MTWTASQGSPALIDDLARFGKGVTDWAQTRSQIAVAMYDPDTFGSGIVPAMVGAHSKTWICGMTMENPYAHASVVS